MAQNKLSDLNNHLFAQLERLGSEDLTSEELKNEMSRTKAISEVSKNIIENARLALDAAKLSYSEVPQDKSLPEQFKLKE